MDKLNFRPKTECRHMSISRTTISIFILLVLCGSVMTLVAPISVHAATHSTKVAYVTDFGKGVGDPALLGSSIFVNAINGIAISSGGTYTTASGTVTTFTDVFVTALDSGGVGALSGYDTVMLYEVCDIGLHPILVTALNTYLSMGFGKVVIYDADRCAPSQSGTANYASFQFPFTTNNPGPRGDLTGSITLVEPESLPATLTRGISTGTNGGFPSTDAVGDSNTFSPNGQGWCSGLEGTNVNSVTGIQVGYLRTKAGGLVIYDGNDNWFTDSGTPQPNAYDKTVFDNILDQPFNPDSLPCAFPIIGVKLTPQSATNPVGTSHTVTANLTQSNGNPATGVTVSFSVCGPNTGKTGTGTTDSRGLATFTYTDTGGAGTDNIVATFTDSSQAVHTSNTANKTWGSGGIVCSGSGGGSVGGVLLPVDKLGLLAPFIGLASVIAASVTVTAIYVRRAKHRKEDQ